MANEVERQELIKYRLLKDLSVYRTALALAADRLFKLENYGKEGSCAQIENIVHNFKCEAAEMIDKPQ